MNPQLHFEQRIRLIFLQSLNETTMIGAMPSLGLNMASNPLPIRPILSCLHLRAIVLRGVTRVVQVKTTIKARPLRLVVASATSATHLALSRKQDAIPLKTTTSIKAIGPVEPRQPPSLNSLLRERGCFIRQQEGGEQEAESGHRAKKGTAFPFLP